MRYGKSVRKRIIFLLVAAMLVTSLVPNESKAKTTKTTKITLNLNGKKTVTKKPAALKKAKKVTVKNTKKSVVKVSVKKKKLTFTARKKGKATVTVICRLKNNKKKTYRYHVTVKGTKTQNTTVKGKKVFTGNLKAEPQKSGVVKLSWTKMKDAKLYHLERRTDKGAWKKIANPSGTSYLDRTCVSGTTYGYRMKARLSDEWTEYGEEVVVTAKKKETTAVVETEQTVTPEKTEQAEEKPTSTPVATPYVYEPKYTYEVEVLNKFGVYDSRYSFCPIVLYIKTDNPNPNGTDDGLMISFGRDYEGGYQYLYQDLQYEDDTGMLKKVKDGWVFTLTFDTPGVKNVFIKERDYNVNTVGGDYDAYGNSCWQKVSAFQIDVQDSEKSLMEHCQKIIDTVSADDYTSNYPTDTTVGTKWEDLTDYQKVKRCEQYIQHAMNYPRHGGMVSNLGYIICWYIQENVGVCWKTGFADCSDSNMLLTKIAQLLGYESYTETGTLDGGLHVRSKVCIDGEKYTFDATPYQGGYGDWDYLL